MEPLGQGYLTGAVAADAYFGATDVRSRFPRFAPEALPGRRPLLHAARLDVTPAQIGLAWLLAQKPWIVPVPGTRKRRRVEENLAAATIQLTTEDLRGIEKATSAVAVQGGRGTGDESYG